ncbi:hypothetical protein RHABOEDO_000790 [Candidatus Rhabdochlamydia oedothoracis]|uniref:Uncharacterized protein n=1 Tax=Candidatus Rhabdochlamydia oedothoracis TaxID=2720720 RepID=A0ABX8V064_9BACT|nr:MULTISPECIES: hypothetical protein [Rhabdochlamydia]KAG6558767.1 hypothetical protein RHOW815_001240 [Candidatus Rhabdochlamydia sp. W815]MCL6755836.1 hypothetical protein [Candidatus Rhabdochlamydia oedothoracis]QYF48602.1 hypothetical protein RHABOEDO_000790 [Candidatus Rhabdochlamydia oedothoracis]
MQTRTFSQRNLIIGVLSGIFAGILLAFALLHFDSILVIGELVGLSNIFSSLFFYLFLTAILGAIFAVAVCKISKKPIGAIIWGPLYGVLLWVINLIMLMAKMKTECPSEVYLFIRPLLLLGYVVFGIILGLIYGWLKNQK